MRSLANLFSWKRLKPFYQFAGGLLVSAVVAFLLVLWLANGSDVWERGYRYTGTVLQLLGILTVAWGVRNTRKQFKEPGVRGPAEKWLLDFWEAIRGGARWVKARWRAVFGPKQTPLAGASVVVSGVSGNLSLSGQGVGVVVQPPLTNEERIELLQKGLAAANERIDGTERRLNNEEQSRASADSLEEDRRHKADDEIREKLKNVSVGGLNLSLMGAGWLFVGTFLAGFAPELPSYGKEESAHALPGWTVSIFANETFLTLLLGALVAWFFSWFYYKRAGDQLRKTAEDLVFEMARLQAALSNLSLRVTGTMADIARPTVPRPVASPTLPRAKWPSRDLVVPGLFALAGVLVGWAISDYYYRQTLRDMTADADERKRVEELTLRGIESVGTITYSRDAVGKPIGVIIQLKGGAAASGTATGALGDVPPDKR